MTTDSIIVPHATSGRGIVDSKIVDSRSQKEECELSISPLSYSNGGVIYGDGGYYTGNHVIESECTELNVNEYEVDEDVHFEVDEESNRPNVRTGPREPSQEEVDEHNVNHLPYRSWCRHCVRGRGKNQPHYTNKKHTRCD